jgi:hypothetical protein
MPRPTVLALAAALGAAAALANAGPALASDPPLLTTGDGETTTSLACGQGHRYVCYYVNTYTCVNWSSSPNGSPVCSQYTWFTQVVYRD